MTPQLRHYAPRALQRGHPHDGHAGLWPRMVQGRQRAPGVLERDHLAHEIPGPQGAVLDQGQHGRVLASGHSVRPVDLELPGHDPVHRQRGSRVCAEQQPDLHVPTAPPQALHRCHSRRGGAEGVQGHVGPAAGEVADPLGHVRVPRRVDDALCPELPGAVPGGLGDVDSHDPGSQRGPDHHR